MGPLEVDARRADQMRREGARMVDVRRDDEWAAGHVEGAEHVPLDQLGARAGDLGERPIVFYCAVGERSLMAAQALSGAGRDAVSLAGGIGAWEAAGLPVAK
ncbi:MAG: rhodanese-like domain-containing protein [Actinomycetota bacterium]|nr:rhodanese-like domain-containing protein [Actinomycetota bacterium]MDQ3721413.1 rhodanese-like domain-containing protein [Actinomycetota bacterium]